MLNVVNGRSSSPILVWKNSSNILERQQCSLQLMLNMYTSNSILTYVIVTGQLIRPEKVPKHATRTKDYWNIFLESNGCHLCFVALVISPDLPERHHRVSETNSKSLRECLERTANTLRGRWYFQAEKKKALCWDGRPQGRAFFRGQLRPSEYTRSAVYNFKHSTNRRKLCSGSGMYEVFRLFVPGLANLTTQSNKKLKRNKPGQLDTLEDKNITELAWL